MPTQSTSDIRIPKWFVGMGKWAIGGVLGSAVVIMVAGTPWAFHVDKKVDMIPEIRDDVKTIAIKIDEHTDDREAHPSLGRISEQIKNLDRMITRRSKSVDGKLDKIDSRIQRQWEAISEIRKRGP